jgi:hypothetical protein
MPQMPANAVHTAKTLAQAASRLVTSRNGMHASLAPFWQATQLISIGMRRQVVEDAILAAAWDRTK